MAIHTDLPIYRSGVQLLTLATRVQEQMPRGLKRFMGEKIISHCVEMIDLMALANATKHSERAEHIRQLMKHQRTLTTLMRTCHEGRWTSTALWSQSVQLLGSIGAQGGGWLKSSMNKASAA